MKNNFQKGMTLIEIMIVIALIAVMAMVVVPSINQMFRANEDAIKREFATLFRSCYEEAFLRKKIYRVVFDLDSKPQTYWIEEGPDEMFLEKEIKPKSSFSTERSKEEKKEQEKDSQFTLAKTLNKKKKKLPDGIAIMEIKTSQSKEGIKEGRAYTHFFPHGYTEKTILYFKNRNDVVTTLQLLPLSGKTKVFDGYYDENKIIQEETK